MKKSSIVISSAAAIVAVIAVSGIAFSSFAADSATGDTELERPFFARGLSDATREQFESARVAIRTEMDANRETIQAALDAGDYNAWAEAVGEGAPVLQKINASNFSRFAEAHGYMEQARSIMEELGVERGGFGSRGMGSMDGFHGFGGMRK